MKNSLIVIFMHSLERCHYDIAESNIPVGSKKGSARLPNRAATLVARTAMGHASQGQFQSKCQPGRETNLIHQILEAGRRSNF